MSDQLIASLNTRIQELNADLATVRAEAKKRRIDGRRAGEEAEALRKQLADLTADRDGWRAKAEAAPSELQAKVDELTGQVRARDHKDAWTAAAGDQLADKVGVADLWEKLGYKPGETLPTPEEITAQVGKAREAAPYLFKSVPDGTTKAPRLASPPGGGRGGPDTSSGKFVVRRSDMRDADWMQQNQARIGAESAAGNVAFVD